MLEIAIFLICFLISEFPEKLLTHSTKTSSVMGSHLISHLNDSIWCNTMEVIRVAVNQEQPSEVFCKKGILKTFVNFTGKHLCWSIFLIKLQAIKKRGFKTGVLQNFSKDLF